MRENRSTIVENRWTMGDRRRPMAACEETEIIEDQNMQNIDHQRSSHIMLKDDVARSSQECHKSITRVSQEHHKRIARTSHE